MPSNINNIHNNNNKNGQLQLSTTWRSHDEWTISSCCRQNICLHVFDKCGSAFIVALSLLQQHAYINTHVSAKMTMYLLIRLLHKWRVPCEHTYMQGAIHTYIPTHTHPYKCAYAECICIIFWNPLPFGWMLCAIERGNYNYYKCGYILMPADSG